MSKVLSVNFHTGIGHISSKWRKLIGHADDFSLESRIFHSISLGIIVLAAFYIPYNLYAGLKVASLSCLVIVCFFMYQYYYSRVKGIVYRSLVFGLIGLIILPVNYFINAGISGSTDLMWPAFLVLLLTICPSRYQLAWVVTYLIVFAIVHWIEFQYPQLVQYPFHYGKGQFIDRITAFPMPVIGMAIVVGLFRRSYDREKAKVEQRDAEKSRLLSILSHDFRAPLIHIGHYLELLNDPSLSTTERNSMEKKLREANDQTLHLVTNLLYWSRSQMEGTATDIMKLSLLNTLKNPMAIAAVQAAHKKINFIQNIDPDKMIYADADMLQLVVRNLLQNAVKFTPTGGIISIKSMVEAHNCKIIIADNGAGISPGQLSTIFNGKPKPTYGTENEKGVGLGLMICKEFMEHQGGHITADSKPGEGSAFTITIPLANN
ncbi:HAMP domain-containing histidine kinase [Mucilaginibacter sp. 21P]|uniref:sensor histidine kinase n=1 Tax=Mucilaginibacter sp. 21P TaxID=2778902 RepID=UPI001C5815E9|nr:HAMP domain-containing sensor histidine kinase [Mucilaginibacter sp. 21P]QXV67460.1 HAMP domain-containing histidine kinase [Mucilaginibacter sp. 21P]